MGERDLDPRRLHVDDDQEDRERRDEREQVLPEVLDVTAARDPDRDQAREEPDRVRVRDRQPVQEPVDQALRDPGDDEEPDPGTDPPLGHDLVHEDDQDAADDELEEDDRGKERGVAAEVLRSDDRIGLHEPADQLRQALHDDHHEDQDLLQAHVEDLATGLGGVDLEDVGALEELEHDRGSDDRADPQVDDRARGPGEQRPPVGEHVLTGRSEAEDQDVGEDEVEDEDAGGPDQLVLEVDVPLGAPDRGHRREQRFESIEQCAHRVT